MTLPNSVPTAVVERITNPHMIDLLVDLRPGWRWLVESLDKELSTIKPDYKISLISSSRGRLKYFTTYVPRSGFDIIMRWEERSQSVCEICGEAGRPQGEGTEKHVYCYPCSEIADRLPQL